MELKFSRSHLEALSFSDLLKIADTNGIDVPENLNRNFLIAEILDAAGDDVADAGGEMSAAESDDLLEKKLPEMYNTTEIEIILQNPVWAFVFWNVCDIDLQRFKKQDGCSFFLRVCSFDSDTSVKSLDSFEMKISVETKEQYVLLPYESEFVAVELYARSPQGENRLAASKIVHRPYSSFLKLVSKTGEGYKLDEVMELSGADKILRKHYMSYRQLFS